MDTSIILFIIAAALALFSVITLVPMRRRSQKPRKALNSILLLNVLVLLLIIAGLVWYALTGVEISITKN